MDMEHKIQAYLRERFGPETKLIEMKQLGKGIHGVAYRLVFRWRSQKKQLIMKTLFPSGFGHDHFSDRAQVLLLANANYNRLPGHVRARDVVAESPDSLTSLGDATEFYILMEEAAGESYFTDLNTLLARGRLKRTDRERVKTLARILVDIHGEKYQGTDAGTLYRRRIRDLVGHGECIMGVIDAYGPVGFASQGELVDYVSDCIPWWGKIRDQSHRLCRVHGDYHPGNIRFQEDRVTLLDRSRGTWGEAADDVACLAANYIYYAIKDSGGFTGPFSELFHLFLECYLDETGDDQLLNLMHPFVAFRVLVLANPDFYPGDTDGIKRSLFDFGRSVLRAETFDVNRISSYINGS